MTKAMTAGLEQLRQGGDFTAFVGQTKADFERMSVDIFRRWHVPPGVDAEDVQQQLYVAFIEEDLVGKWDPTKGPNLKTFTVWQAYTLAKRWLHEQRGAKRRDGKAPSRFPISFSQLGNQGEEGRDYAERGLEGVLAPTQEDDVAWRELAEGFRTLLGSPEHRMAFDVIVACGGCQDSAVHAIATDPRIALRCEVGSEEEAEKLVRETVAIVRDLVRQVLKA